MKYLTAIALTAAVLFSGVVLADTTFTYQGSLKSSGQPHTGTVGMEFRLYDATAGGIQHGPTLVHNVQVTDGLFQANLDFGVVFDGNPRYLEITVNGTLLTPRQAIQPVPMAMIALDSNSSPAWAVATNEVFSGSSNVFVPIPGSGVTFTQGGDGNHAVVIRFNAELAVPDVISGTNQIRVHIPGLVETLSQSFEYPGESPTYSFEFVLENVPPGEHEMNIEWRNTASRQLRARTRTTEVYHSIESSMPQRQ